MDRGVNPSSTLGEQYGKGVGDDGSTLRLRQEHHLSIGEGAEETGGQETIFTKKQ